MTTGGILMSKTKIEELAEQSGGVCISCGAVEYDHIEPDAINYKCSECGERSVVGMECALIRGFIIPSEKKRPTLDRYMKKEENE